MIARVSQFVKTELWGEDLREASRSRRLLMGTLRVTVHAVKSFSQNVVDIQAAGLTMVTLLAMVPIMWLALGVAKMLGFDDKLDAKLAELLESSKMPDTLVTTVETFQTTVKEVSFEALGLFGSVILAFTGYMLFTKVEKAFNHTWRARRRSWYGRLSGFIALVVLVPLLLLAGIVGETALQSGIRDYLPFLSSLYETGTRFVPAMGLCLAFTLLYKLMPSAKVSWRAAAIAGGVATLVLILFNRFYIQAQVGLAVYNEVYAALAALPMLFIYLTLFWTVILVGVQVSFAVEHVHVLGPPADVPELSHTVERRLALALAHAAFADPPDDVDLTEFTQGLDVPREWVDEVAEDLVAAGILRSVEGDESVAAAKPAAEVSLHDVVHAVDGRAAAGTRSLELPESTDSELSKAVAAAREILAGKHLA